MCIEFDIITNLKLLGNIVIRRYLICFSARDKKTKNYEIIRNNWFMTNKIIDFVPDATTFI